MATPPPDLPSNAAQAQTSPQNHHGNSGFRRVTEVTAAGAGRLYLSMHGRRRERPGREEEKMARIVRTALKQAQTTAIVALGLGASLGLPVTLAGIGFHTL